MKITYYVGGMFFIFANSIAQNDLGTKVKEQSKTSSENRTLNEVDKAVNKTFDAVKDGAINVFKKE